MKLYMHPVSMTTRPVRLLIQEHDLPVEEQLVDILSGEHYQDEYTGLNPNRMVPMLEEGDWRLTESSAIMKYLADKFELESVYPKDLAARARVNEVMDWFNTNFYRDYGYGLCYPQVFPHHKRPSEALQSGTLEWARERVNTWLGILDSHILSDNDYVCGDSVTIADYFGVCLLTLGEALRLDFGKYPKVAAWVERMKGLDSWASVNEALYGFRDMVKDQQFVGL